MLPNVIWSAAAGFAAIGGTFASVIAGAAPGVPPRGVVRTTCEGGSGVPLRRWFHMRSIAWMK